MIEISFSPLCWHIWQKRKKLAIKLFFYYNAIKIKVDCLNQKRPHKKSVQNPLSEFSVGGYKDWRWRLKNESTFVKTVKLRRVVSLREKLLGWEVSWLYKICWNFERHVGLWNMSEILNPCVYIVFCRSCKYWF